MRVAVAMDVIGRLGQADAEAADQAFELGAERLGTVVQRCEPGSRRFEVLADEQNPDLFYLDEVYADVDANNAHASGPYFDTFFSDVRNYAEGPTWLMRANLIGGDAAA